MSAQPSLGISQMGKLRPIEGRWLATKIMQQIKSKFLAAGPGVFL